LLRVEKLDAAVQGAVGPVHPFVDRVEMLDGSLVVGRRKLDANRDVRQHHVQDAVARGLAQKAVCVVHRSGS
jgi:hypothetical protein